MKKYKLAWTLCMAVFLLCSCAPVNRFTRAKHIPREYSGNYGIDNVISPRSELNKRVWIVYSDRENNPTYIKPGGKVKFKQADFLTPFLVVRRKGNFLKLVRYTPEMVKDEKLVNRKKADYFGWMDKSQLLLTSTSVTDIRSGFKNKVLTAINDTLPLFAAERFFSGDSVKIFSDPNLTKAGKGTDLYQVVYRLKRSEDGFKWLIATKPDITPDQAKDDILGWIDNIMLQEAGQRLWVDNLTPGAPRLDLLPLSPVFYPQFADSAASFRTFSVNRVIDRSNNYIYNVDGDKISFAQKSALEQELRRINVVFAFETAAKLKSQLPTLVSAIQNMTPFFSDRHDFYYQFAITIAKTDQVISSPMTGSLSDIADFLEIHEQSLPESTFTASATVQRGALNKALEILSGESEATNIIINIGESLQGGESADAALISRMASLNCRLLGFQLYAGSEDKYNNFVLQTASIIEGYASAQAKLKRRLLVFPDQIRRQNQFTENTRNSYMLDFPRNSATQGLVVFPEKGEILSADMLVAAADTLVKQVKSDNLGLIRSFEKALLSAGNEKDIYDSSLISAFRLYPKRKIDKNFRIVFNNSNPPWVAETDRLVTPYTESDSLKFSLLLTADELERLKGFIKQLSDKEVDIKGSVSSGKGRLRTVCEVRRELEDSGLETLEPLVEKPKETDTLLVVKYASTRKLRRYLYDSYVAELRSCSTCGSRKQIKKMTLADAHGKITSLPSIDPLMTDITIKELRSKKDLPDPELDALIQYLKRKKKELDKSINQEAEVSSSGQKYYLINGSVLP